MVPPMTRVTRCGLPLLAGLAGLAVLTSATEALAHSRFPPRPGSLYAVGCYWYRGHHYCNRYCYREIDGYHYCHNRRWQAGTQAPPPIGVTPSGSPVYRRGPPYR